MISKIELLLFIFVIAKTDCLTAFDAGVSSIKELTKNKRFNSISTKPFIRHRMFEEYFPGK